MELPPRGNPEGILSALATIRRLKEQDERLPRNVRLRFCAQPTIRWTTMVEGVTDVGVADKRELWRMPR